MHDFGASIVEIAASLSPSSPSCLSSRVPAAVAVIFFSWR